MSAASCVLTPDPGAQSLSHGWNRNFVYLHFISQQVTHFIAAWILWYSCTSNLFTRLSVRSSSPIANISTLYWQLRLQVSPLDLKASLCGSVKNSLKCPSTFHSWYWKREAGHLTQHKFVFTREKRVPTEVSSHFPGILNQYQQDYSQIWNAVHS